MNKTTAPKKASREDWHPADVIAALHKRGLTLRSLSSEHGLSHNALSHALRGQSGPSEQRVAEALGLEPRQIWPSRYNADGTRIQRRKVTQRYYRVNGKGKGAA
ncbi:MAG TPA: helix-turn-helix transcriptional regulator [Rhodocyclaceae bacterium]